MFKISNTLSTFNWCSIFDRVDASTINWSDVTKCAFLFLNYMSVILRSFCPQIFSNGKNCIAESISTPKHSDLKEYFLSVN